MSDRQLIEDRLRAFASVADDSDWQDVVRRAEASEPVSLVRPGSARRPMFRRRVLLALAAVAVAVPTAAFADDIGRLLGLTNQGTPVATSSLSKDTTLAQAMKELGFPSTLQFLGSRDGISFYAVQKPGGEFCFAVTDASLPVGQRTVPDVGCDGAFPSPDVPVSVSWVGGRLAGFAADGVASVNVVDASGQTIATADVRDNLFVGGNATPPTGVITVEPLDKNGDVLSTTRSESFKVSGAAQAQRAAQMHAFALCMRKHGVPNFPDPTSKHPYPGSSGQLASPSVVQAAAKTCSALVQGAPVVSPAGTAH
jgi:hypothetical protein